MSRVNTIQSNPVSTDTEGTIESVFTINRVSILNLEKNRKSFPGTMQTVCNNEVSLLGGFRLYSQAKDKIRWYIMRLLIFMPCKTFWHLQCDTINSWLEVFASSSFSIEGLQCYLWALLRLMMLQLSVFHSPWKRGRGQFMQVFQKWPSYSRT